MSVFSAPFDGQSMRGGLATNKQTYLIRSVRNTARNVVSEMRVKLAPGCISEIPLTAESLVPGA